MLDRGDSQKEVLRPDFNRAIMTTYRLGLPPGPLLPGGVGLGFIGSKSMRCCLPMEWYTLTLKKN